MKKSMDYDFYHLRLLGTHAYYDVLCTDRRYQAGQCKFTDYYWLNGLE